MIHKATANVLRRNLALQEAYNKLNQKYNSPSWEALQKLEEFNDELRRRSKEHLVI